MSDLENKLRSLAFREPPQDLRRSVLAAADASAPRWTWRDWMWPSPFAWAGLASLWIAGLATQELPSSARPLAKREPSTSHYVVTARFPREVNIDSLFSIP